MTEEQRKELEKRLADDAAEEQFEREYEVEIGKEGNYARVPYSKAKKFLQDTFGIDLDDEAPQDAPAAKEGAAPKGTSNTVRFGRTVAKDKPA
jgi:hypothetical protein